VLLLHFLIAPIIFVASHFTTSRLSALFHVCLTTVVHTRRWTRVKFIKCRCFSLEFRMPIVWISLISWR
jgi:hypothetical protein